MPFIINTGVTSLVNVKLTDKGRELLTKGLNEQDTFDVVKFAFGDSEIDYTLDDATILSGKITQPDNYQVDFNSKLYQSGVIPSGSPSIVLSVATLTLKTFSNATVSVGTDWPPIDGEFVETYVWQNIGPIEPWELTVKPANNSKSAVITSYDTTGTTIVRVVGQISGRHNLLTVTVE